jgi:hypothetical protein
MRVAAIRSMPIEELEPVSTDFHDPYDEMSDDEFDEDTARLFNRPKTTVQLTISQEFYDTIKALAEQRGLEPVNQLMVHALNLGIREILAGDARVDAKRSPLVAVCTGNVQAVMGWRTVDWTSQTNRLR